MKKTSLPINVMGMLVCGFVLHISYEASGHAAWSLLVSTVRHSPWELVKPFGLVYIMWSFIEMSCLRPHLLRFVSCRMVALVLFVIMGNLLLWGFGDACKNEWAGLLWVATALLSAEVVQLILYNRGIRTELFFVPLVAAFVVIFFALIFCTFYPPGGAQSQCSPFHDDSYSYDMLLCPQDERK